MMRIRAILSVVALLAVILPAAPAAAAPTLRTTVIQRGLTVPWDVAFTPNNRMLVTERPGRIRIYAGFRKGARLLNIHRISKVRAEGESGAMGIAVGRFAGRTQVFVCVSRSVGGAWRNQVLRYRLVRNSRLDFRGFVIRRGMRAASIHNGCALELGGRGRLYVGMGDAGDTSTAQAGSSRNGKILRVNRDGSRPSTNPFKGSLVWSRGHRNPQGLAFRPRDNQLYAVEHGPDVHDELNRIVKGGNYGWPCWTGRATRGPSSSGCKRASRYRAPAWSSGGSTVATSGAAFVSGPNWDSWRGDLLVSTLKESDVRRLGLRNRGRDASLRSTALNGRFGRLRAMVRGKARRHAMYLTTSNSFSPGTDRVIRLRAR
jgi:glucose/arabinose dehydrogenase